MNKSLVPLILILTLIVLLTVIITNTTTIRDNRRIVNEPHDSDSIRLSPYQQRRRTEIASSVQDYSEKQEISRTMALAYMAFDAGKLDEAADQSKTVLIFEPENEAALALLGRIYYRQEKFNEAEKIFRQQIEITGSNAVVYNNLGQALARQHKFDDAARHLVTAYELNPDALEVSLNLSGIYSVQGKKKQSLFFLKKAFEKMGDQILVITQDPTLDNIREEPEFKQIINAAETQRWTGNTAKNTGETTEP